MFYILYNNYLHHICPNKKKNYKKYRELIIYTIVFFKSCHFYIFSMKKQPDLLIK
jgi:hypothetical protein